MKTKVTVFGLGYIGLPTAGILAENGFEVLGIDVEKSVVESINSGKVHISEPDLNDLIAKNVNNGNLRASTEPIESDVFIIAVPTPFKCSEKENKHNLPEPDLKYIFQVINSISRVLKKNNLIILESTSPIGTTKKIQSEIIKSTGFDKDDCKIAYCPERVIPGNILKELVNNDRVVGGVNKSSTELAKKFYSGFCKGNIFTTDSNTAEMVKLSENAYRDVNIAFANELSIICENKDINVRELIKIANCHPRVNILNPGAGVGGHCIAIDPWFIAWDQPENTPLIQTSRKVNNQKTEWIIKKIKSYIISFKKNISREPIVGIMGLAFKADCDDLRESPALKIFQTLKDQFPNIYPCDPYVNPKNINFEIFDREFVINKSDLLVFLVSHSAFADLNIKSKRVIDICGILG